MQDILSEALEIWNFVKVHHQEGFVSVFDLEDAFFEIFGELWNFSDELSITLLSQLGEGGVLDRHHLSCPLGFVDHCDLSEVVSWSKGAPRLLLCSTGSDLHLALAFGNEVHVLCVVVLVN